MTPPDTRELAERFAKLFRGGPPGKHCTATPMKRGAKGGAKVRYAYEWADGPPTIEHFEQHLRGERGLVVTPVDKDGITYFCAIDIDRYDLSEDAITQLLRAHRAPFIPVRSKSGGWHLYAFFPNGRPASDVRRILAMWVERLGFPATTEQFPKQDALENDDCGNAINLPYFGGDEATNRAFCPNHEGHGEYRDVVSFVSLAETPRELREPTVETAPDDVPGAAVDLLMRHWQDNQRQRLSFAATGFLLRAGISVETVESVMQAVIERTGQKPKHYRAAADVQRALDRGRHVEGFPTLVKIMGDQDAAAFAQALGVARNGIDVAPPREPIVLLGSTADDLLGPIAPETYVVPLLIPAYAYSLIAGALSSFKSTLLLYLAIWRATGHDLLNLGGGHVACPPGPVVLLSYEDTDDRALAKLQRIVQYGRHRIAREVSTDAARAFAELAAANIRRLPLAGRSGDTIVTRLDGVVIPNAAFIDELLQAVHDFAPEGVLLGIDPLRLSIVGSQNDDDGADIVVHTLNRLAAELPKGGVVAVSHTTKQAAADGAGEGYAAAAYATSGSGLFSQHARSNFYLARLKAKEIREEFDEAQVSADDASRQAVARLIHARLSHGPESHSAYFKMQSGVLVPVRPRGAMQPEDRMLAALPVIVDTVDRLTSKGLRASASALRADDALRTFGGDQRVRDLLAMAEDAGYLAFEGNTKGRNCSVTDAGRAVVEKVRARCGEIDA